MNVSVPLDALLDVLEAATVVDAGPTTAIVWARCILATTGDTEASARVGVTLRRATAALYDPQAFVDIVLDLVAEEKRARDAIGAVARSGPGATSAFVRAAPDNPDDAAAAFKRATGSADPS